MAKDPICGMYVNEHETKLISYRYNKPYYFCSDNCKIQFEKPEVELAQLKRSLIIAWPLTIAVLLLTYAFQFQYYLYVQFLLAMIVQFYPGLKFYRGTVDAVKNRSGNMDSLIAIGTSAAWLYSSITVFFPKVFPYSGVFFDTSTIIISLVLTGNYMDHLTKAKASEAVNKLIALKPKVAHLVEGEATRDIPLSAIVAGNVLLVKPGETMPVDGVVTEGTTTVDESAVTGESLPIDKKEGSTIISGTMNKFGSIKVRAMKSEEDSTINQIIKIVEAASTEKVPMQKLVDQILAIFVPGVILVSLLSFSYWYFIGKIGITFALLAFISVLIIACPCALGIATPAALIVASGKAAENGILVKGGEYFEIGNKVNAIFFDKTGTLTEGNIQVKEVVPFYGFTKYLVLKSAAEAELKSEHPLGKAVVREAQRQEIQLSIPRQFEYFPGKGVVVQSDRRMIVGSTELLDDYGVDHSRIEDRLKEYGSQGVKILILAVNDEVAGIITLSDTIKKDAKEMVSALKKRGIEPFMISGDNEIIANAVAKQIGIGKIFANVKPENKLERIKEVQGQGRIVAMVGDGINDAPALEQANLGIAIGAGTDVAIETGGVVLMKSNLRDVVYFIDLSKKTISKIKQNLFWAFGYNVILIPVAAGALIPFFGPSVYQLLPILAAFAMAFSSTTVVSNSLLLRGYKPGSL